MTEIVTATPQPQPPLLQRFSRADLLFAAAILLLVVFAASSSDAFLTQRNIVNISRQIVTNGFLSLGMLMVIRTGGIDLSVGSVLALRRPARHRPAGADAFLAGDRSSRSPWAPRSACSTAG